MTPTTNLYFEAHVTIEPVFNERLEQFRYLARDCGFKVADLLMQKRPEDTPERSRHDTFATGRHTDFATLSDNTQQLINLCLQHKFSVWRYKIEDTLIDVRLKG